MMEIKNFNVNFNTKEQPVAAYLVGGTLEIYVDGYTFSKKCAITTAKKICKQLNIEWEWGDKIADIF